MHTYKQLIRNKEKTYCLSLKGFFGGKGRGESQTTTISSNSTLKLTAHQIHADVYRRVHKTFWETPPISLQTKRSAHT